MALDNDTGFAFAVAQFSRLKEELLRACDQAVGERYLMNAIVPAERVPTSRAVRCADQAAPDRSYLSFEG